MRFQIRALIEQGGLGPFTHFGGSAMGFPGPILLAATVAMNLRANSAAMAIKEPSYFSNRAATSDS